MPFNQYKNAETHEETTGWVDPKGGFVLQSVVGQLYAGKQQGATVPVYGCKSGSIGYFVSDDSACGGALLIGVNGFALSAPQPGAGLVPLYTCNAKQNRYVSRDSKCEGNASGTLLGYAAR